MSNQKPQIHLKICVLFFSYFFFEMPSCLFLEVLVGERLATFQEHHFLTPESRFWGHLLIFIKGI